MVIFGAIFDLDGTLFGTEEEKQRRLAALRAEYSLPVTSVVPGTVGGDLPGMDIAQFLGMEYDEFIAPLYAEAWASVVPKKGVMEIVYGFRALGLPTAIASLGYKGRVMPLLEKFNLLNAFDAIKLIDDVPFTAAHPNPKREVVQLALNALKLSSNQAVGFEDSPSGVRGFLDAGVPASQIIAIPNSLTQGKEFPEGVRIIQTMAEMIPLDRFLASF